MSRTKTTAAIHEHRLQRLLPKLAAQLGLDPDKLRQLAESHLNRCAICTRPIAKPHLYLVDECPRGVICGYCSSALARDSDDPMLLADWRKTGEIGRRWKRSYIGRMFLMRMTPGPFG